MSTKENCSSKGTFFPDISALTAAITGNPLVAISIDDL